MDERVSLVKIEARITPSANAGNSNDFKEPQKSTVHPAKPPAANNPQWTDSSRISKIPSQNSGVANPSCVKNITDTSAGRF